MLNREIVFTKIVRDGQTVLIPGDSLSYGILAEIRKVLEDAETRRDVAFSRGDFGAYRIACDTIREVEQQRTFVRERLAVMAEEAFNNA